MRLPPSASPAPRTSAGTMTLRRCGPANLRSAPAQAASTTSLGETLKARRIVRRSSSERVTRTWWRCGEPGWLSAESGAGGSSVCATVRASPVTPSTRLGALTSFSGASASEAPSPARSTTPRAKRSPRDGVGTGSNASGSPRSSNGSASRISRPSSAIAMPSTMQWWALQIIAIRPSGSSSAIQNCHSGRSRGSGVEKISSAIASRSSPRAWRTCSDGSKSGSSTHAGSCTPSGTGASFWRQRGECARRPARNANSSSKPGRGPSSGAANVETQPTCIGAASLSTARNDASRADRRSAVTRARPSGRGSAARARSTRRTRRARRRSGAGGPPAACGRRPRSGRTGCRASLRGRRCRARRG